MDHSLKNEPLLLQSFALILQVKANQLHWTNLFYIYLSVGILEYVHQKRLGKQPFKSQKGEDFSGNKAKLIKVIPQCTGKLL